MNIFYVDSSPSEAAKSLANRHVVKMILESAQMLCTAHRVLDGTRQVDTSTGRKRTRFVFPSRESDNSRLYHATHVNHPCNVWVRSNVEHYNWLYHHFHALCTEYTKRYGKVHKSEELLLSRLKTPPEQIEMDAESCERPYQAMPDNYKHSCPVTAYQQYYIYDKIIERGITGWKNRRIPVWVERTLESIGEKELLSQLKLQHQKETINACL